MARKVYRKTEIPGIFEEIRETVRKISLDRLGARSAKRFDKAARGYRFYYYPTKGSYEWQKRSCGQLHIALQ